MLQVLMLAVVAAPSMEFFVDTAPGSSSALGFSSNYRWAVAVDEEGLLRGWEIRRGDRPRLCFARRTALHPEGLRIFPSPNGTRVLVTSTPGQSSLIELKGEGTPWPSLPAGISEAKWSDDGRSVLLLAESGSWLVRSGVAPKRLPFTDSLSFGPGDTAVGLIGQGAGIYNLATGRLRRFTEKLPTYGPVALSPDGRYLVTGGEDPQWEPPSTAASEAAYARTLRLKVWRVGDGKRILLLPGFESSDMDEASIEFLEGHRFVGAQGEIRALPSGKLLGHAPRTVPVRLSANWMQATSGRSIAWNGDGKRLAVSLGGGTHGVVVWDLERLEPVLQLPAQPQSAPSRLRYDPAGDLVIERINDGVTILNPVGRVQFDRPSVWKPGGPIHQVRILPDGRHRLISDLEGFKIEPLSGGQSPTIRSSGFGFLMGVLPDGSGALGMAPDMRGLVLRDLRTGADRWALKRFHHLQGLPEISSDGQRLLVFDRASDDLMDRRTNAILLDAANGQEVARTELPRLAWHGSFSPDGRRIALATPDGLEFRDGATLALRARSSRPFVSGDEGLAFSPDGRVLATIRAGQDVRFYDADTGRWRATLVPMNGNDWVAFTSEGAAAGTPEGLRHLIGLGSLAPVSRPIRPEEVRKALAR